MKCYIPILETNNQNINKAFRIAIGDLFGNTKYHKSGLLKNNKLCIMAGSDYNKPWTRDTAINIWNGSSLLIPEISYNTLISVIKNEADKKYIGGQYWDAIIWTTGAWWHYLYTGDKKFLKLAFEIIKNSIHYFENTEFDRNLYLFRGPACCGDGVAAYPDEYANTGGNSGILDWPKYNPDKKANNGYGIPIFALSTNCLYYNSYKLLLKIENELNYQINNVYEQKALKLKESINKNFWNDKTQKYRYIIGPLGNSEVLEGMGHSFILLFEIADKEKSKTIIKNQYISQYGIPCVWPVYSRYQLNETTFGRHNGTVWPHVQGFWATAVLKYNIYEAFDKEFNPLTNNIVRDSQCAEIYHPVTGEIYGGVQERGEKGILLWKSCNQQTWSATAYIRMVIFGLLGMQFHENGVFFKPYIPNYISTITLKNLHYRNMILNISISNNGVNITKFLINNIELDKYFLSAFEEGDKNVEILME